MTLIIGDLDISKFVMQKTDITEAPIYSNGVNAGESKSGYAINDRKRHTRYSFSVPLIPLKQSDFVRIIKQCEANELQVLYTSALSGNEVVTMAQCSLSGWRYALTFNGERIYAGGVITVVTN